MIRRKNSRFGGLLSGLFNRTSFRKKPRRPRRGHERHEGREAVRVESLEDRCLLTTVGVDPQGVMTIQFQADGEQAFIQRLNDGFYDVGSTSNTSNLYSGTDVVSAIRVHNPQRGKTVAPPMKLPKALN